MNLKPISDNLVIKQEEPETKTASGIIIPDSASAERSLRGTVVAAGPGKLLENGSRQTMEVRVGDKILFKTYAPEEIEIDGGREEGGGEAERAEGGEGGGRRE